MEGLWWPWLVNENLMYIQEAPGFYTLEFQGSFYGGRNGPLMFTLL